MKHSVTQLRATQQPSKSRKRKKAFLNKYEKNGSWLGTCCVLIILGLNVKESPDWLPFIMETRDWLGIEWSCSGVEFHMGLVEMPIQPRWWWNSIREEAGSATLCLPETACPQRAHAAHLVAVFPPRLPLGFLPQGRENMSASWCDFQIRFWKKTPPLIDSAYIFKVVSFLFFPA